MDKDFMLNYYDKMVRPIWTELMKTPRYQRARMPQNSKVY